MAGKPTYDPLDLLDSDSKPYHFRSIEERELEKEERELALKLLRRRDNILKAVYLFTERFLRMRLTESGIEPILEELGHASEVSRVYVFENHTRNDAILITSQRYEWVSPEIDPQIANPDLQEMPWVEAGFGRWVKTLGKGQLIYGNVEDFPESEKAILSAQSIISIMAAPIMVGDDWWGFIGFDDCQARHEWAPVEIEALKTAANIIGAAIQRKQAEEAVMDSEKKYRLVVDNANEGIVITQDGMLKFVNPQVKEFTGISENNLKTVNFFDYIHPDDREMAIEHHRKRLAGEDVPGIYSLRIVDREGNVRWIQNNGVMIEWEGRPASLNFLLDITASIQAEDKIRALTQEQFKVQENERNRIARHLHDHVAQDLSSLKINLETLFDEPQKLSPQKKKKMSEISQVLQDSISSVRDLSYDLRPAGMDQLGLVRIVYQLCEAFSEKNNLSVDFYSAGIKDLKLDFDTAINLYRLIQEGLNNIKKHARADNVIIRLVASSPNIILRIEDDGRGFDVAKRLSKALKEKRMGLPNMEERVSMLKGKMDIKSRIDRGTRIFIEIPWQEKKNGR